MSATASTRRSRAISRRPTHTSRAVAPVAGVLLVAMTVLLGVGVTAVAFGVDAGVGTTPSPAPTATFSLAVDGDRITITHRGGDSLAVDGLRVVVAVNGEPLTHQPPVPFFSARGFRPGPTGPFNPAAANEWTAGTAASIRIAGTNDPQPMPGDAVTVRLVVDDTPVAVLSATVEPG